MLFNLVGVCLIFPIPQIRAIPVLLARRLGMLTLKNRLIGIGYVVVTFFLIPLSLLLISGRITLGEKRVGGEPIETEESIGATSAGESTVSFAKSKESVTEN